MKKVNTYFEIIKAYYYSYKEICESLIAMKIYCFKIKRIFNDKKMAEKLKKELDIYLLNVYKELEVLKFLFKNEKHLYVNDIYRVIDKIDENYEKRFKFFENMFRNLQVALDMQLDYKFYIPQKYYKDLCDEDIKKYINEAKGFSINSVCDFLDYEKVMNPTRFNEIYKNAKIIDCEASQNLDLFGFYTNDKMILPKINDELSTLITIHEMVHYVLKNKKNLDPKISYGEDLPKFYELLYKKNNDFIKININFTQEALMLLEVYNNESFEEQIIKLKKIK